MSHGTCVGSSVPSLAELHTADPDQFVAKYTDIGAVNLACARGLGNCDEDEFPAYLALLDTIAEAVRRQTEKNFRLFKLKPKQFNNSENVFRLLTMEHVFRVQFGVKYDPKVRDITQNNEPWMSDDSSELFIHGLLSKKRTGTCSSLPTFAIAIGRRLGYPLKLILVPNHTLYRWDDGTEVFNLQPNDVGGDVREDEYYKTWPRNWDEYDYEVNARTKVWLHSLTPRKETSKFLCNRALMLRDAGRHDEALKALDAAERFDPINPACLDIRDSVEYAMAGGDIRALLNGEVRAHLIPGAKVKFVGGFGLNVETPPSPAAVSLSMYSENSSLNGLSAGPVISGFASPLPSPSELARAAADRRLQEEAAFADEHYRLVNLINESNRNRSPQHPNGNPPTEPLMRQLTRLLQGRKGH
jgi:hypothetical protein